MTATNALQELHDALQVMQSEYFELWLGKWTTAIDWTAAVMNTHMIAALSTLSLSVPYTIPRPLVSQTKLDVEAQLVENEISRYFSQTVAYYFGEDHFAIRQEAYDDMLWVVLGWLDSIQFIRAHSALHYTSPDADSENEQEWHGTQFISAFAHRARVFYDLAAKGWDWRLCGGGMTWNPHLLPYKNAITNELFISASMSMYLHFPGDANCSPFLATRDNQTSHSDHQTSQSDKKIPYAQDQDQTWACDGEQGGDVEYNPIYLQSAIHAYDWLKNSGMTNDQGLYTDGFHIKDYARNHSKTDCDERNEMVYTYNQGVLLSGLRGLWEATGNVSYLEDGYELVRNVIRATGWSDDDDDVEAKGGEQTDRSNAWHGLGSQGILTEQCDPYGTCSQDGQTFKGIFMHHLTSFCASLPRTATRPGRTVGASRETAKLHRSSCNEYAAWIMHNGVAALETRDEKGRFGMWWGASLEDGDDEEVSGRERDGKLPEGAIDYRNEPPAEKKKEQKRGKIADRDLNDRGRGRSVETQGGGVAITRAMWEFLRNYEEDEV
jgi:hypothetical protein